MARLIGERREKRALNALDDALAYAVTRARTALVDLEGTSESRCEPSALCKSR